MQLRRVNRSKSEIADATVVRNGNDPQISGDVFKARKICAPQKDVMRLLHSLTI
jgi:hypothetical protein